MDYDEAKAAIKSRGKLYRAYTDGQVWSGGRMVDAGETIGYYATEAEAKAACKDVMLFDFDDKHMTAEVEEVGEEEFSD